MRELSESDFDPKRHPIKTPVVTAFLFETYPSCPTKCFRLATGVAQSVNAYASWASERSRIYQDAGIKKLAARYIIARLPAARIAAQMFADDIFRHW